MVVIPALPTAGWLEVQLGLAQYRARATQDESYGTSELWYKWAMVQVSYGTLSYCTSELGMVQVQAGEWELYNIRLGL